MCIKKKTERITTLLIFYIILNKYKHPCDKKKMIYVTKIIYKLRGKYFYPKDK
jgi:hypothetical protein